MRNIHTLLLLFVATSLMAADVTYVFSEQGFTNNQKLSSGVIDPTHNTAWKASIGTGTIEPAYYDNGSALRIYGGGTFTISSDRLIDRIVLTLGGSEHFEQDATQTPNDYSFEFTRASGTGHVKVQKIEITYGQNFYTVAQVMNIYNELNLSTGASSIDEYTVRGYVTKWNSGYPNYQNADFFIDDSPEGSTSLLKCYRLPADNENDKHKLEVGTKVEIVAHLMNYNGQAELKDGTFHILSAPEPPPAQTYTLTVSAGEGGSVNSTVNGTYEEGTHVTITATPDKGYLFVSWSDDVTDNPRTLTMTKDFTLKALFEEELTCAFPDLEGKKGDEILLALHEMISNHNILNYDNLWADKTNIDLREDGTIWDIYSDCSFNKKTNKCGNSQAGDCNCYNREHTLPRSWWGHDNNPNEPMNSDLHHIYATDGYANYQRSAWPYGEVTSTVTWSNSLGSKLGYGTWGYSGNNYSFEPADEYKGDIARIYFYMITCYNDKNFTVGGKGYKVFTYNNNRTYFTSTAKDLYLKWHRNDPVSQKEIDRNNAVEKKQGNRNPFVDEPDLAEYIWGKMSTKQYTCHADDDDPVENIPSDLPAIHAKKIVENGHLLILLHDGKVYNVIGLQVK